MYDDEHFMQLALAQARAAAAVGEVPVGAVLVRGGESEVLEGPWAPGRLVMLKFPSRERAQAFYNSETYTHARSLREGAGVMRMVVVDGVAPAIA